MKMTVDLPIKDGAFSKAMLVYQRIASYAPGLPEKMMRKCWEITRNGTTELVENYI